ncbi:MAG: hypothetical protein GEU82_06955 [Luteitalea sp.]|nr:hypothetical protein [Luteitalea sp.]
MVLLLALFAFFLSGFAALVYQIVWQRLLVLPIGAEVHSTTLIVAALMAGLGCGSLAGGHLADRLTPSRNLLAFVAAEAAVGSFGFVSRFVFYDWQYLKLGAVEMHPVVTATMVFFSLLWPTFWMGLSLPLLGRGYAWDRWRRETRGAALRVEHHWRLTRRLRHHVDPVAAGRPGRRHPRRCRVEPDCRRRGALDRVPGGEGQRDPRRRDNRRNQCHGPEQRQLEPGDQLVASGRAALVYGLVRIPGCQPAILF